MPHAPIDGFEMYYELHGSRGDPVVLVHGYTGDVTDWRHQVADLAADHRVLAMDHRGHGRSGAPKDRASYTIERMADDLHVLLDAVGLGRFHLVGHSMGGMVAQELALRLPERLITLALEDTGPEFPVGKIDAVRKLFDRRLAIAERDGMAAVAALPVAPAPHQKPERIAEERARLAAMSVDGFAGAWAALCAWGGSKSRAPAIRIPTLVVHGELDAMVIPGSTWLAENIPSASLDVIPEAAHSPQYERPDLFNAALRRHFARS